METIGNQSTRMSKLENRKNSYFQQCNKIKKQIEEESENCYSVISETSDKEYIIWKASIPEKNLNADSSNSNDDDNIVYLNYIQKEPIDLTFDKTQSNKDSHAVTHVEKKPKCIKLNVNTTKRITVVQPDVNVLNSSSETNDFRSAVITNNSTNGQEAGVDKQNLQSNLTQILNNSLQNHSYLMAQNSQTSNVTKISSDILIMAKSLFSKRTCTLYHWMYPTASHQQIRHVVSNMWESMTTDEKNVFISQVLAKFGYQGANLMINPQLEQIKKLPPPVPKSQSQNYNRNRKTKNAISTAGIEKNNHLENYYYYAQNEPPLKKPKLATKNFVLKSKLNSSNHEFDDDPELKRELAQFSNMLKNNLKNEF